MEYDFLVGIGGVSMSGLAELLRQAGHKVGGSDVSSTGHSTAHITPDITRLIITSAVSPDSPGWVEVEAAKKLHIPVKRRAEVIGELMRDKIGIAIAGTHGKTSTTTIFGRLLEKLGADPTVMVGGSVPGWDGGLRLGQSGYFVLEACEYERQLLDFPAKHALITSLEPDHFDTYATEAELMETFRQWLATFQKDSHLVVCSDEPRLADVLGRFPGQVHWYGSRGERDELRWTAVDIHPESMTFSLRDEQGQTHRVETALTGSHQAANLTGSLLLLKHLGFPLSQTLSMVGNLQLAKRRLEYLGERSGAKVYDDYGHHPTEITATVAALKARYPERQLVLVYEPHQISRTVHLLDQFAAALSLPDETLLLPVYKVPGRDADFPTSTDLQQQLIRKMTNCSLPLQNYDDCIENIQNRLSSKIVVLTMGATAVHKVAETLVGGKQEAQRD